MSLRRGLAPLAALLLLVVGAVVGAVVVGSDASDGLAVTTANDVDATPAVSPSLSSPPAGGLASTGTAATVATTVATTDPAAVPDAIPTAGPDDVEFYDYLGGFRLPWSPTAGPAVFDGNLASGFAHTPMGAVMAGPNIATRLQGTMGAPVWVPTIEEQVVGPHKVYVVRAAQASGRPDSPAPGEYVAGSDGRFVGWQWVSYRDDVAVVRHLLTQGSREGLHYLTLEIRSRWVDGDWRLVAPDNANWIADMALVPDDSGFHLYTRT